MRIGIVVEGSNAEAGDVHAIRAICNKIATEHNIARQCIVIAGGSKPAIIQGAAEFVKALKAKGCTRVVIVWDNCPPWTGNMDVDAFVSAARAWRRILGSGQLTNDVYMVCARRELEAWILTDETAIKAVLSDLGKQKMPSISGSKKPDTIDKPKDRLQNYWYLKCNTTPSGKNYCDMFELANITKLRRSPSFCRLEDIISR